MLPKFIRFGIAAIIFSAVLFGVHFFVFWTLSKIASSSKTSSVLYTSAGIVLSMVLVLIVTRLCSTTLWCICMYLACIWLGFIVNFFLASILYHLLSFLISIPTLGALLLILGIGGCVTIYGFINASCIHVDKISLTLPGFHGRPVTIAHLSDLHLGAIHQREFVQKVANVVRGLNPDLVVITGDLVDGNLQITPEMLSPLENLGVNVYFVLGNHEEILGIDNVLRVIGQTSIKYLKNEQADEKDLTLVGVDFARGKHHLIAQLANMRLNESKPNILLYHVPVIKADELEKYGIKLHLAGHTHGGQFPPFQPFVWLANAYFSGLYSSKSGECKVYVSTGIGSAGPPMRIFSRSVIGYITIHGEQLLQLKSKYWI
eukprot:TRINITY_DN89182_c0_g1_i1.p1 TRINITY_DN89182_c0_g1~~TRINITY_DN89182_c0_g1_i1.p1  ORF type:complete len:413 (-),score=-1.00 TRINITY_DN89182_c0_g1_i1:53-1174(-)